MTLGNKEGFPAQQNALPADRGKELLITIKTRFEKNRDRHRNLEWAEVEAKLIDNPAKMWSLNEMERTGGEPDVVGFDKNTGEYLFYDCSAESPKGRRAVCYDRAALESRKEHKPKNNAVEMAAAMGDAVEENFAQQGRPAWMGWSPAYARQRRGGKIPPCRRHG
ncbi:MAG: DUF4256 family protein, partial [Clostridia bacterium]|nr:DUF4256 family protein [Clostridia bacterium]